MVALHGKTGLPADDCWLSLARASFQILSETVPPEARAARMEYELDKQKLLYCERFTELLIDLLSQLPTRRFVRTLLEDKAILIKCRMSSLLEHPQGEVQQQLLCQLPQHEQKPLLCLPSATTSDQAWGTWAAVACTLCR